MSSRITITLLTCLPLLLVCLVGCAEGTQGLALDNGKNILAGARCDDQKPTTCPGAEIPSFKLQDVQPNSPNNGQTYGLDDFIGKPILVALLASW